MSGPVVTITPPKPYPTVGDVLQLARVKVNDAFGPNGLSGDLLASTQPATPVYVKSAWRQFQASLADAGFDTLIKEIVLTPFPVVFSIDPSVSTYLAWDGNFDGQTFYSVSDGFIALPQDLILPRRIWERPTGSATYFSEVVPWDGGLPDGFQSDKLRWYEWRDDKIFFKGATVPTDLKIRYASLLPDLDAANDGYLVPVMFSDEALACMVAEKFARPRGSQAADSLMAQAQVEVEKICNRTARRKAVISYRRQPFGGRTF